jgi:hypothetical protein
MKYEFRSNEHREIELWPENAIETAFLESMGADANKGQPVSVTSNVSEDGESHGDYTPRSLLISMGK